MTNQAKIALELQPCCWDRSGIGTYTYEIATRLRDNEDMKFCGNLFNFCGRRDNTEALKGLGMPVRENRILPYGVYRRIWNWIPIPYQCLFPGKADISIFFNFIVPPHTKGKILTVVHDLTYLRYPETMKCSNLRHLERGIASSIKRSDKILTVSEFSKKEIQELLHVPAERIAIVPNAPSLPEGYADYREICRKYGIHGPYILFVSTIEPRKNIVRLILAFERLKTVHRLPHMLVLAGGKGWQDAEILRMAKEISCAEEVIFTGYVSAEEKKTLYQHADVFVFPSIYEGFGIPPLEAMSLGCPVVCSDRASMPEVVGEAACMVNPFDEESIASGILHVLSDPAYAQILTKKGYLQAKRFSWEKSADDLIAICRELLEKTE